jgi:hypothetical protein
MKINRRNVIVCITFEIDSVLELIDKKTDLKLIDKEMWCWPNY